MPAISIPSVASIWRLECSCIGQVGAGRSPLVGRPKRSTYSLSTDEQRAGPQHCGEGRQREITLAGARRRRTCGRAHDLKLLCL